MSMNDNEGTEEMEEETTEEVAKEKTVETVAETAEIKEEAEEAEEETEESEEAVAEAEKVRAPKKKGEAEENIVEERIYTVPFGKAWIAPRNKRSTRATRLLRSFVGKHMKTEHNSIKITSEVNEKIWSKGIEKPPRKLRVRVAKDEEGTVTVHLAEEK